MRENKSPAKHNKGYVLDAPAIGGAAVIVLMVAGLTIGVLNQKKGPAGEKLTTPTMEGTEEIQRVTGTVRDAILTTQDLQDTIEDARVKALFNEAEAKAKKMTNEEIFDNYKIKIAKDDDYIATDDEIEALARLGYGVVGKKDGGGSIPFKGDGRQNDNKEKK